MSPRGWPALVTSAALALAAAALAGGPRLGAAEPAATAPDAPALVRRLTEAQYRRTIADLFGPDIKVVGRFEPDLRVDGLLAVGASRVSVTPAGMERYEEIARGVAEQVTDTAHRDALIGCAPGSGDPDGARCAAGFLERTGLRLYRRPLPRAEVQRLTAVTLAAAARLGDFHAGLATTLAGMLAAPDFLFRIDLPAASGRSIDGFSRASRLSYLLWNTTPDAALLTAAARGELDGEAGLAVQVDRMIASPRFADGVRAFFSDYLLLDDIDTLSKDLLIYPSFSPTVAAATGEQTLRTITDLLIDRQGDYRDLFTTRRLAMTRVLGPIYDIPVTGEGWYMHEFPANDPRTGLLTQASLLALHSHPGRTSPTLRGKAIREVLLCDKVLSPPANVNFAVVQDVNNPTLKTTRARLQAHLDDEECASCHKATDPPGLALEQFDAVGSFRTSEHGEPIDASGTFAKAAFVDAAGLGRLFHDDPQVTSCLVRSVWRYASARNPGPTDQPGLAALTAGFAHGGYRLPALFRAIVLDPSFYAVGRPPERMRVATRTPSQETGS